MGDRGMDRREWLRVATALAGFVILASYNLAMVPQPWWDEGWTMSVARNWVEHGHYGHYLLGQPSSPALSAHLPVVTLVALGFELLGVGMVQARMVFVLCSVLTLLLLYVMTRTLFSRRAAAVVLLVVCIFPPQWELSMFLMGRQVLGEIPAVMFIFVAVLMLWRSDGTRWWSLIIAGGSFGLALTTKSQVVPFVVLALAATSLLMLPRDRPLALRLMGVLGTAVAVMYGLGWLRSLLLMNPGVRPDSVVGLTEVTAMVFDKEVRINALRFALAGAMPLTAALCFQLSQLFRGERRDNEPVWNTAVRRVLFLIGGSWFAWFVFLSVGWGRYAFPPFLLASPFVAALIVRLVDQTRGTPSGPDARSPGVWSRATAASLLALFLLVAGRQIVIGARDLPPSVMESGLQQTATYLNMELADGDSIETYESELLFLLDRPVHFPPPQLNVDTIRKNYIDPSWNFPYDLTTVTADYIVVGAFGKGLYDPLVAAGRYRPFKCIGTYTLLKRTVAGQ